MNSDSENSDTGSENDVDEIEAMLYSQIHHSVDFSSVYETQNTLVNQRSLKADSYFTSLKDNPDKRSISKSIDNRSGGNMQISLVNKENLQHAANEDVIVLSSDDECEILVCEPVSKYNYQGANMNKLCVRTDMDQRASNFGIESKNTLTVASRTGSATCMANLFIHIDGVGAQRAAEEIDVGSDSDIASISSSDDLLTSVRKRKRETVVTSPRKRQATNIKLSKHSSDNEDCIIEIPVPVRKGDDWFICDGDRYKNGPSRRNDFHRKKLHIICHNCNHRGHITKTCPKPIKKIRCFICGDTGHHGDRCFRATCSLCWETGHSSTSCQQKMTIPYKNCNVCYVSGHMGKHCPDYWRRYHLTIEPGELVTATSLLKPRDSISCCNCGQKGHYIHECRGRRMDFTLPNRPDVISYEPVHDTSNSQMLPKNGGNVQAVAAFRRPKRWKRNAKQKTMQAVSSVKETFRKHFRFSKKSTSEFKTNGFQLQGTSGNNAGQKRNARQLLKDNKSNVKQKRKWFWINKSKQQKWSNQNVKG